MDRSRVEEGFYEYPRTTWQVSYVEVARPAVE